MAPITIFISYSHDSFDHGDRVLNFANRLIQEGINVNLDQYESSPPEGWPMWMDRHILNDDFILMVCTDTYFHRVMGEEQQGKGLGVRWEGHLIYQHIYSGDTNNSRFIPILFEDCAEKHIPIPLLGATHYKVDTDEGYEDLYRRITNQPRIEKPLLGKLKTLPPRERRPDYLGVRVSLSRLPSTSADLFGREEELMILDQAWENRQMNIISLNAWAGVGKTALVNKWLLLLAADNFRGAECIIGWSFFSQGAVEGRQVSADQFITFALKWFGDPDPTIGQPWEKGERLAELVKRKRTILIFDGLEPLQHPPPIETGRIRDPALSSLLRELGRQNPGLVIITTRLPVDDLKDFIGSSMEQIALENLSPDTGAEYLTFLGVKGPKRELKCASGEYDGHALALTLLGSYLKVVYNGDVFQRDKITRLTEEKWQGACVRRLIESYERWFEGTPELDILFILGLFDRPAKREALDVIKSGPIIEGLTAEVQGISHSDWHYAVENLRSVRLIAAQDPNEPDTLDCHPLLREYFSEKLCSNNPRAWKGAHNRLYEHYKSCAVTMPGTIEEMVPHFAAVAHGCQAGLYEEALNEIYWGRINSYKHLFITKDLGAPGADLSMLSNFFRVPWSEPVTELSDSDKSLILNYAGAALVHLGRFEDAIQTTLAGLDLALKLEDWRNASIACSNVSGELLAIGDIKNALTYATQSVDLSNRCTLFEVLKGSRVSLATVLHRAGKLAEAETVFKEAEEIQSQDQPLFKLLYSASGFEYCRLLLSQGKYEEVQKRANQTLKWAGQYSGLSPQCKFLDRISLGRAYFMEARSKGTDDYAQAESYLEYAVMGLRQFKAQEFLAHSLLVRAEFFRVKNELKKAWDDLDEAFSIITQGGMKLYMADCYLEFGWLNLESGKNDKAQEYLEKAKNVVKEIGYHQLDSQVIELEANL